MATGEPRGPEQASREKWAFLSYAHEDLGFAQRLYNDLVRRGVAVWFDKVTLLPGQNWRSETAAAIQHSSHFLAILSGESVSKVGYVQKELRIALEVLDLHPEGDIFIIPVRKEPCEPRHHRITELHWIDMFPEVAYDVGLSKLLSILRPGLRQLRSVPRELLIEDVAEMVSRHGFFESVMNPQGPGVLHGYELFQVNGDEVVLDDATGLLWMRRGARGALLGVEMHEQQDAVNWTRELNAFGYAGRHDWRIPTLEEALSLMEPTAKGRVCEEGVTIRSDEKKNRLRLQDTLASLHIDPIFGCEKTICTCDEVEGHNAHWRVHLDVARCGFSSKEAPLLRGASLGGGCLVRAVCTPEGDYLSSLRSTHAMPGSPSHPLEQFGTLIATELQKDDELSSEGIVVERVELESEKVANVAGKVMRGGRDHELKLRFESMRSVSQRGIAGFSKVLAAFVKHFVKGIDEHS